MFSKLKLDANTRMALSAANVPDSVQTSIMTVLKSCGHIKLLSHKYYKPLTVDYRGTICALAGVLNLVQVTGDYDAYLPAFVILQNRAAQLERIQKEAYLATQLATDTMTPFADEILAMQTLLDQINK